MLVAEGVGVDRGLLARGRGRLARVDHGELHVSRRGGVGRDADLHLVHLADQQRLGARACVPGLVAVRVRAVVVVVGHLGPVRPRAVLERAGLHRERVVGDLLAVLPGDADSAVPEDGHGIAGQLLAAGRRTAAAGAQRSGCQPRTRGCGEAVLRHVGVDHRGRHRRRRRCRAQRDAGVVVGTGRRGGANVHRDRARRGRQRREHQAERQQLLARRDVPAAAARERTGRSRLSGGVSALRALRRARKHGESAPVVRGEGVTQVATFTRVTGTGKRF